MYTGNGVIHYSLPHQCLLACAALMRPIVPAHPFQPRPSSSTLAPHKLSFAPYGFGLTLQWLQSDVNQGEIPPLVLHGHRGPGFPGRAAPEAPAMRYLVRWHRRPLLPTPPGHGATSDPRAARPVASSLLTT